MTKTSKIAIGIAIVALMAAGGWTYAKMHTPEQDFSLESGSQTTQTTTMPNDQQADSTYGRAVVSVRDAAMNMNTIDEINVRVTKVELHSSTSGWITASTTPRTYNLLKLNRDDEAQILVDINAKEGVYDQVRITVDSITVKEKGSSTLKEAKLPSNVIKINTTLIVQAGKTASLNFDFLADKSLHKTGDGKYIFIPVIKTETRSDSRVTIGSNDAIIIDGGHIDSSQNDGMDIDGSIRSNFEIDSNKILTVDNDSVIRLGK